MKKKCIKIFKYVLKQNLRLFLASSLRIRDNNFMDYIKRNISAIQSDIETTKASQSITTEIDLVVATKYSSLDQINALYNLGLRHFGENKIQDGLAKQLALNDKKDIQWHMIGTVQSNKLRKAAQHFSLIQSIDRLSILEKLHHIGTEEQTTFNALLQFNVAKDPQKSGFQEEDVPKLIDKISELSHVNIQGAMTILPYLKDEKPIRNLFEKTRKCFEKIKNHHSMNILSMGMSHDFKHAIKEGSTMIRIGRRVFSEE